MPVPTSRDTAPHYGWGAACDGWHLVRAPGLSVIEEQMPSGAGELRHRHARARQFFYVLAGTLTIEVRGTVHALAPGTGLEVEPGEAHQPRNDGDAPVRVLVVSQPPSHGDREPAPSDA